MDHTVLSSICPLSVKPIPCVPSGVGSHIKQRARCYAAPDWHWASACRFNYSQQFLQWALQPPGYQEDWVLGVRVSSSGKLVAFITGVPATVRYSQLLSFSDREPALIVSPRQVS